MMENAEDLPPPVVQEFLVLASAPSRKDLLEHTSLHPPLNALGVCKGLRDGACQKPWRFCGPLKCISIFTYRRRPVISPCRARTCAVGQKSLGVGISNYLLFHVLGYWLQKIPSKEVQTFSASVFFNFSVKTSSYQLFYLPLEFLQNTENTSQKQKHEAYQIPVEDGNRSPLT